MPEFTTAPIVTYKHLIAGSVYHYQKKMANKDSNPEPVKTITFSGKKGGIGYYFTSDSDEIAELDKLAKNPQVQIERVDGDIDVALETPVDTIAKPIPTEVTQATAEVLEQSAHASDPKLIAAQEGLAALLKQQNS